MNISQHVTKLTIMHGHEVDSRLKSLLMSDVAGRMDKVVGHIPRELATRYFLYRRNSKQGTANQQGNLQN